VDMSHERGRKAVRVLFGAASLAVMASLAGAAWAEAPAAGGQTNVEEVTVVAKAVRVSPSAVPLEKAQPTSEIQQQFIQNNIIPLASFDDLVKFSPSVADQSPNGPGLGKSETLSLRGFQDGQFNITFDGIPFGDATDLHHTSSALFIAHDIGQVQIDRGPGSAATIGNATFGGSMNFVTKAPLEHLGAEAYGTVGSFNTYAWGGELDTGANSPFGRALLDAQHETSDGYLTHASERRTNLMFKDVFVVNNRVTVTALGSYNHAFEYTTQGATLDNIKAHGPNFGLGDDPKTQNYYGYQPSNYMSDFEYIDVKAQLTSAWRLQNTLYTDAFGHSYLESKDATDTSAADNKVTVYSATNIGKKIATLTDIPGKLANAHFRAYGDILRLTGDLPMGQVQAGVWIERNNDARWSESTDLTLGDTPVVGKYGTPYSYNLTDTLTTIEPYAEFDWNVTSNLTVTPGVRYSNFRRTLDALYNKNTVTAADFAKTYGAVQPSVAARYTIMSGWNAYAQVAKGFLAPPINLLEVAGGPTSVKPEETWNYQVGTAFHRGRWVLGLDAYYIDFANYITSVTIGGQTGYINGGGAIYSGAEFEGQYVLDHGFSLYANATYNSAKYKHTSVWLAETPEWTAAAGVLYDDRRGPYASLIAKWIGSRYGLDVPVDGSAGLVNSFGFDPYVTADFAAGWRFHDLPGGLRGLTASVKVSNIFDNRTINDYAGQQSYNSSVPIFWTVAGRSAFFNLSASF
jgi:iron complex outermembrane recepter protein